MSILWTGEEILEMWNMFPYSSKGRWTLMGRFVCGRDLRRRSGVDPCWVPALVRSSRAHVHQSKQDSACEGSWRHWRRLPPRPDKSAVLLTWLWFLFLRPPTQTKTPPIPIKCETPWELFYSSLSAWHWDVLLRSTRLRQQVSYVTDGLKLDSRSRRRVTPARLAGRHANNHSGQTRDVHSDGDIPKYHIWFGVVSLCCFMFFRSVLTSSSDTVES